MGRRRKTRTHVEKAISEDPKSFIIKHGPVGASVTQLVRDFRKVMEPNTASRLRERNRNKLKDYLTIAPTLQVSHLLAFTLTPVAPSLRLIRLPAGPTLSFRVERYSLMKDLLHASKRPRSIGMEYLSPPLVVLASFPSPSSSTPAHIPLLVKAFQSLFPSLSPKTLTLSSARRVVLISYNSDRETIDFRHYIITVKPYGVSGRVRKLLDGTISKQSGFLDLGNEKDVADFLLRKKGDPGGGYESAASSTESVAGDDAAVDLADDYVGRNNKKGQKRAVKLDEVGPRMELRLLKITEGPPGREGAVLYHQFVKKTRKEIAKQTAAHAAKEKLRKERREEQEKNVARKKALVEDPVSEAAESDTGHDDVGEWDEDEEISEDEVGKSDQDEEDDEVDESDQDEEDDEVDESDQDEEDDEVDESDQDSAPPIKRLKTRSNKR